MAKKIENVKIIKIKGEDHVAKNRITEYDWQLAPYKNLETNKMIYFLNKLYLGRQKGGSIVVNKSELRSLKHFMKNRKIK